MLEERRRLPVPQNLRQMMAFQMPVYQIPFVLRTPARRILSALRTPARRILSALRTPAHRILSALRTPARQILSVLLLLSFLFPLRPLPA